MGFDKFIKQQVKSKKKPHTVLEEEELKKKQKGEAQDYLTAVGSESEDTGAKWTIEAQKEVDKEEELEDQKAQDDLEKSKHRSKKDYLIQASLKLAELADTIDWPKGYRYRLGYDGLDKISLMFHDKNNNVYARGIKLTGTVFYDVNALHILVTQAENTVDQLEGQLASQKDIVNSSVWKKGGILKSYLDDKNSPS